MIEELQRALEVQWKTEDHFKVDISLSEIKVNLRDSVWQNACDTVRELCPERFKGYLLEQAIDECLQACRKAMPKIHKEWKRRA